MTRNFYIGNLTNGFVSSKISLTELERMKKDMSTTRELSSLLTVRLSFTEISSSMQEHKMTGLSPGCTYGVDLRTVTGNRQTRCVCRQIQIISSLSRQPIFECVMTKPLSVETLSCDKVRSKHLQTNPHPKVSTSSTVLQWVNPEAHKRLKAFSLHIQSADGKVCLVFHSNNCGIGR